MHRFSRETAELLVHRTFPFKSCTSHSPTDSSSICPRCSGPNRAPKPPPDRLSSRPSAALGNSGHIVAAWRQSSTSRRATFLTLVGRIRRSSSETRCEPGRRNIRLTRCFLAPPARFERATVGLEVRQRGHRRHHSAHIPRSDDCRHGVCVGCCRVSSHGVPRVSSMTCLQTRPEDHRRLAK